MALPDDILRHDARFSEAHRRSDGRGDPLSGGFRRRLSVEPRRDMTWAWIGLLAFAAVSIFIWRLM